MDVIDLQGRNDASRARQAARAGAREARLRLAPRSVRRAVGG